MYQIAKFWVAVTLLFLFPLAEPSFSLPKQLCLFQTKDGKIQQVLGKDSVPSAYRSTAKCFDQETSQYLAKPQDVVLGGNVRRESINSPLGSINLRWPRKVESLFGKTPLRATTDAAQTVAKALGRGSVPSELQNLKVNWEIVFLDEDLPETQIPTYLISNCHPGWMTAPGNIYIVGQRVAGGCGGPKMTQGVADAQLAEVLVHEMGHGVEHALLKANFGADRMRAEGFATWFQNYASQFSSLLSRSKSDNQLKAAAVSSFKADPNFSFQGTFEDYARASLFFRVIEEKRGVSAVFDVEKDIAKRGISFLGAVEAKTNWKPAALNEEVRKYLKIK